MTYVKISHEQNIRQQRSQAGISRSKAEILFEWKRIFEKSLCQYC